MNDITWRYLLLAKYTLVIHIIFRVGFLFFNFEGEVVQKNWIEELI